MKDIMRLAEKVGVVNIIIFTIECLVDVHMYNRVRVFFSHASIILVTTRIHL